MIINKKSIVYARHLTSKEMELVPLGQPSVVARMEEHKRILASFGVTDVYSLGKLTISGAVIPKPGVLTPKNLRKMAGKETKFHSARRLTSQRASSFQDDHHTVETVAGRALVLDGKPFYLLKPTTHMRVRRQSLSNIRAASVPTTMPLDCAYWAATSIEITDDTLIVLQQPHRFLVIIAEQIKVGNRVSITWQRENRPASAQPPTPLRPEQKGYATARYADKGLAGLPGLQGDPGANGGPGPEIEFWTLSLQGGSPSLDVAGQDGFDGGRGGNGGPGGHGQPGQRRGPNCKPPAGISGCGGDGGRAGDGGPGGDGGYGGRFSLYAPGDTILRYAAQGFYIDASGGARGRGGPPGEPGPGGSAGAFDYGPPKCENDGWPGSQGQTGRTGVPGYDGDPGGHYANALSLIPINEDIFRIQFSKPAIVNLSADEAVSGEQVEVFGERFSSTDIVHVAGLESNTVYVSENQLSFTVPPVVGGYQTVEVRQVDSTLSNRATLRILPVITHAEQQQETELVCSSDNTPATFLPGSEVFLIGSGFAPGAHVKMLGEYLPVENTRYIDSQRLACKLIRPSITPHAPEEGDATGDAGEIVDLCVSLGTGENSQPISIRLRVFKIAVFGDSIVWGQGLQEHLKFHSLVAQFIGQQSNIGVYKSVRAHSGATIGHGGETKAEPLHGEINTSKPTIRQQVDAYAGNREAVSLVLLDGGINDIGVKDILNFIDSPNLPDLIESCVYTRMFQLLQQITGAGLTSEEATDCFPNAKVVVSGYYQIVSEDSDLSSLKIWLAYCLGPLAPLFVPIDALFDWTEEQQEKMAKRCEVFARTANKRLAAAVSEINGILGQEKVLFADPRFQSGNAIFATNSLLWGFSLLGSIEDTPEQGGVAPEREAACSAASPDRLSDGQLICEKASVGHPNIQGAARYADAVKRLPILA